MKALELKLKLPDALAEEAKAKGLLRPSKIASLLRGELRRRRVDRLFAAADRMTAAKTPPMTEDDLDAVIQAVRSRRRAQNARRR